jgi:hypothetical protein
VPEWRRILRPAELSSHKSLSDDLSPSRVSVNGSSVFKKSAWVFFVTVVVLSFRAEVAKADVASWMYVGGGIGRLTLPSGTSNSTTHAALALDTGFGTDPLSPVVVGFAFKALAYNEQGIDLGVALRGTSSGYSRGDWGVALDLGVMQRFWDQTATLPTATLGIGLPWGVTLAATGSSNFEATHSLAFTLGFDWARLTAHRASGESYWRNYRLPVERP